MDFIDQIRALSARVSKQLAYVQTEEATKSALVLPFIQLLGYDVFNPTEVIPEFTADIGTKKGEKVDYAVLIDSKPVMLFECKWSGADLDESHISQLYRYFAVTDTRIGVLTNGLEYRFYSDLESPNKMDTRPFLVFRMLDVEESLIGELKKLSKDAFDLDEMLSTAGDLKYTREIRNIFKRELASPSEDFIKYLASQVYSGRMTQSAKGQFADIVQRAFKQFVNEQINNRLKSALNSGADISQSADGRLTSEEKTEEEAIEESAGKSQVVTTETELEGYYIIKSILRETVDPSRVFHRDTKSYMGILLDNNNRKPICRLLFNNESRKQLMLFGEDKASEKVSIESLNDIFKYDAQIKQIVKHYDSSD